MPTLTADELNAIAKQSGYTGGSFSSVGLTAPTTNTSLPTAPKVLTTANLAPQSTETFKSATLPPVYPISSLNAEIPKPDLTLTAPEVEAQSLLKSIMEDTTSLTGETAFRAEQEKTFGVQELQKAQTDLASRLKALQNEAQAIPLQLQQESEGRGRTVAGLAPIQADALRKNAIQALTTSSLLEASRGNLTTALSMVDRAVEQEYGPKRARREAKIANLELLMKSPAYTLAEKKRAQAQLDYQKAQQEKEELQKQNSKEIWSIATTASSNGNNFVSTTQYPSLALALDAISKAQTKEQALGIASATGLIAPAKTAQSQVLGSASTGYFTYDPVTGKTTPISGGGGLAGGAGGVGGELPVATPYQTERAFRTVQSVDELKTLANTSRGIFGRTAALPIPEFLRSDAYRNFKSQLDTLKSNIAFNELTAMREASKTGGALGNVSDKEAQLLQSALGALSLTQTPQGFIDQLEKIKASIQRWQSAVNQTGQTQTGGGTITSNGQQYTIGQVYQDGSGAKWVINAQGQWIKQ